MMIPWRYVWLILLAVGSQPLWAQDAGPGWRITWGAATGATPVPLAPWSSVLLALALGAAAFLFSRPRAGTATRVLAAGLVIGLASIPVAKLYAVAADYLIQTPSGSAVVSCPANSTQLSVLNGTQSGVPLTGVTPVNGATDAALANKCAAGQTLAAQQVCYLPCGGTTAEPEPVSTPVGEPLGDPVSARIGAGGGSLTSPDGQLTLVVPAGALSQDTDLQIQRILNNAPGALGLFAYRLTPDGQTFNRPVQLVFSYTEDDLDGTAPEALGGAFQTASGHWQWVADPVVDQTAKTITLNVDHFTDFSPVKGWQIRPATAAVKPGGTVNLRVVDCYWQSIDNNFFNDVRGYACDDSGRDSVGSGRDWRASVGRIQGSGNSATYTAPSRAPAQGYATVSVEVRLASGWWALSKAKI